MTEVIEAPAGVKPVNHWIGGKPYVGASGRVGPVYNPATGAQTGAVDFASEAEVDTAVQAAAAAFPAWRELSIGRRAELFFRIRELFHDHRADLARLLTLEHGKVHLGRAGRGGARTRGDRVLLRHSDLLKGSFSEQASTGIDVYSASPAARGRRRDHAVQLPGDGAHVDVGDGGRVREHVHPQAHREGPAPRSSRSSWPTRRACPRASSTWSPAGPRSWTT